MGIPTPDWQCISVAAYGVAVCLHSEMKNVEHTWKYLLAFAFIFYNIHIYPSAITLKPMVGEENNIDALITMHISRGGIY